MSLYLGIDLGTSGIRSVVINKAEQIVSYSQTTLPPTILYREKPCQNPQDWWKGVMLVLNQHRHQLKEKGLSMLDLAALSVNGTSGTMLFCDQNINPLTMGFMYHSGGFDDELKTIHQHAPPNSIVRSNTSGLARMLYLQKLTINQPTCHCLSQADWILARLMNDQEKPSRRPLDADENNTLKWGYDLQQEKWPDWFPDCGVRLELLPKVCRVGTRLGSLSASIIDEFTFNKNLVCIAGTTDSNAAFLASGADQIGDGVTSLGTTLSIKLINTKEVTDLASGVYSHRIGNFWLAGGASNTGGGVLLKYFTREEMASLSEQINPDQRTGLDYYPLIKPGERFPVNNPQHPVQLQPRPEDQVRFFQGMLEGMASIEKMGYQQIKKLGGVKVRRIFTSGGGAKNDVWRKIRENMIQTDIVNATHDQAAYGTALLASGKFDNAT